MIGRKAVKLEFFQTNSNGGIVTTGTRAVLLDAVFEDVQVTGNAAGNVLEIVTASDGRIAVSYNKLANNGTVQLVGTYEYAPIV